MTTDEIAAFPPWCPGVDRGRRLLRLIGSVAALESSISAMLVESQNTFARITYRITGSAAHARLQPLVPSHWSDDDGDSNLETVDFLWENAPRQETRHYRDSVRCYSHLPNATQILDSKWVLAKLQVSTLTSYCFRGNNGLLELVEVLGLDRDDLLRGEQTFYDLLDDEPNLPTPTNIPPNLWVIKDSMANGAGGVWVVGPDNVQDFLGSSTLHQDHGYVAQQYAWPPVLYGGRKCHVRVYGLITSDGRAFCHNRCFLHVANDSFSHRRLDTSVHITNCCANSHDSDKFAGEICADLTLDDWGCVVDGQRVVPLKRFAASIHASLATLAERTFPFIQGGQANNGFEYLGMDFILSHNQLGEPVAHLLEVNAPPSQDTATGLPHAEHLHDAVIRDIFSLWVFPKVSGTEVQCGGWECVFTSNPTEGWSSAVPSKAALFNRMRWALFERKQSQSKQSPRPDDISRFVRMQFPYFQDPTKAEPKIFFENAGGTQVPSCVIDKVCDSLRYRHRTGIGAQSKQDARQVLHVLLGANDHDYGIFFGANATSLVFSLASQYVRSGLLQATDEILISTENHLANITPWKAVARCTGATVRWLPSNLGMSSLEELLNENTRIVAIPHASNILGELRSVRDVCEMVKAATNGRANVVVDGVAAVPHVFAAVQETKADFYVISCHKMFGPHIGALCGRKAVVRTLCSDKELELGTVSYEACAGIVGLGEYFARIGRILSHGVSYTDMFKVQEMMPYAGGSDCRLPLEPAALEDAYRVIESLETPLTNLIFSGLAKSMKVRILGSSSDNLVRKLPVVSFEHSELSCSEITDACIRGGVVCRSGTFLSHELLHEEYGMGLGGVVRVSVAHYNTPDEVRHFLTVLESIPGY